MERQKNKRNKKFESHMIAMQLDGRLNTLLHLAGVPLRFIPAGERQRLPKGDVL